MFKGNKTDDTTMEVEHDQEEVEEKQPAVKPEAGDDMEDEEEEAVDHVPDMRLAQTCFRAVQGDLSLVKEVMEVIKEHKMAPYYNHLCTQHPDVFQLDEKLLKEMQQTNEEQLKKIEETYETAVKDMGDMEVLDAMFDKANMFARIGDPEAAHLAYNAILDKEKTSTGKKIDAIMAKIRVGLFHVDMPGTKESLERAAKLVESGGDWDRRNRLKVYEAFYLIMSRDITAAAALLLECVATFTCVELCSYEDFVFYAVVTNVLKLPRTTLKEKIIDGPEVLTVMPELPAVKGLVNGLYDCDYSKFLGAMVEVHGLLKRDRYFHSHATYMVRELRILAYTQFLEAYKSVIMASMARQFGVGVVFLDAELSRFIAAGRLNAKIDKVAGVVETNRPDSKNAQYLAAIKQGDVLLNRVQKLARVIDV